MNHHSLKAQVTAWLTNYRLVLLLGTAIAAVAVLHMYVNDWTFSNDTSASRIIGAFTVPLWWIAISLRRGVDALEALAETQREQHDLAWRIYSDGPS